MLRISDPLGHELSVFIMRDFSNENLIWGDYTKERGNSYTVYPLMDDLGCNRFTFAPLMYAVGQEGLPVEL
jgi:hypothetical protein